MNTIEKQELFEHLSSFLKSKGVVLEDGPYTQRIKKGCGIIADTVNKSQSALAAARGKLDRGLDKVRQVIHEKTAPKPAPTPSSSAPTASKPESAKKGGAPAKPRKARPSPRPARRRARP